MQNRTLPRKKTRLRVAIYLRVSTAQQLEGYGLNVQDDVCRALLDRLFGAGNYEVTVFTDGAVSGKLANRPDLDEMNGQIRAGMFDVVVFGKLDRIGRTMKDIHRWMYDTTDLGVRVLTGDGRIDSDDDMFGIVMSLLAFMAELEHALILERTMGGRDRKLTEGGWPSGVPPYGLALQGQGKDAVVVLHEDEVHATNRAVDFFLETLSKAETGRKLNEYGDRRRSGRPWDAASVDRLLTSSHLLEGVVYFRKTDGSTKTKVDEDGQPLYGPTVALSVPRILTEERAKALAEALKENARDRRPNENYPLSKRINGSCGKVYVGAGRDGDARMYRCQGAAGAEPCGDSYLEAEAVEAAVWDKLSAFLEQPERLRHLAEKWAAGLPGNHSAYSERAASLRKQVASQQTALKNAIKNAALLGLDAEAVKEATDEMNMELEALRSALAESESWLAEYDSARARAQNMINLITQAQGRLHTLDPKRQAEVFEMLDIRVTPGEHKFSRRSGRPCTVTAWHVDTGTPVPDDPDDCLWGQAQDVLLDVNPELLKGRFDTRQALGAMLHRLRTGATWEELDGAYGISKATLKRTQSVWFRSGAWGPMMTALLARGGGTPVYQAPTIPPLKVRGKLSEDLFTNLLTADGSSRRPFGHAHVLAFELTED